MSEVSFYGLIWRILPGPTALKVVEAVILALAVVAALFTWVFPLIAPYMPFNETTVGQ
ncbi:MAG TPA: hypothetical protein VK903_15080 [Propionicimonas sp.]|nr:hypothetical protein [Propionicimonas sp.]